MGHGIPGKEDSHECHSGFGLSEFSFNAVGKLRVEGAGLGGGDGQELDFGHVFSCLLDSQTGMAGKHGIGVGQSGKV